MDLKHYTVAELQLMVTRHSEGRVTLPSKMLGEVKAEIAKRMKAISAHGYRLGFYR